MKSSDRGYATNDDSNFSIAGEQRSGRESEGSVSETEVKEGRLRLERVKLLKEAYVF